MVHARRGWQTEIERRTRAVAAERAAAAAAARRLDQERVRVARELHDDIAHRLSVISIHAALAAETLHDDPAAAEPAVHTIADTSRAALAELRRTVAALRTGGALRAVKVLVLTTFDLDEHVIEAVRAGASGFLLKDARPDELRRAVRATAAGEAVLAPAVTRRMLDTLAATPKPDPTRLAVLTEREREVLAEVGLGLSNGEIAGKLRMSPATARTHVSRIMGKLHARDRVRLVVIAHETGIAAGNTRHQ